MDNILIIISIPIASFFVIWLALKFFKMWSPKGPGFKFFLIKEGRHRARPMFYPTFRKKRFDVEFEINQSCYYHYAIDSDQDVEQVNKIYGLSYCLLPRIRIRDGKLKFYAGHHWNSVRIGFNSTSVGMIQLYSYKYIKGIRSITHLGVLDLNKLRAIDCNDYTVLDHPAKPLFGYHLWPYIGGVNPAKRDCLIKVKVLE